MKNKVSKIITGLAIAIFIMAIGIMISGTIAISRNEPVYIFGYALAVVPTDSMVGENEDSLDINDLVIIKKIDVADVNVTDQPVIVYQGVATDNTNILIIHRVVGEDEYGLITQGDNNALPDQTVLSDSQEHITSDNFQGIYVTKITFLKPVANIMANSRSMIFAVIAIILTAILLSELISILKTINEKKKEDMAKAHESELEDLKETTRNAMKEDIKKEYMANLEQSRDAKL